MSRFGAIPVNPQPTNRFGAIPVGAEQAAQPQTLPQEEAERIIGDGGQLAGPVAPGYDASLAGAGALFGDIARSVRSGLAEGIASVPEWGANLWNVGVDRVSGALDPLDMYPERVQSVRESMMITDPSIALPRPATVYDRGATPGAPIFDQTLRGAADAIQAEDSAAMSPGARAQDEQFSGTEGFGDTFGFLVRNPAFAARLLSGEMAEELPALLAPGGAVGKVLAGGAQAGALNAREVRDAIASAPPEAVAELAQLWELPEGDTEAVRAELLRVAPTRVFERSTAVNTLLQGLVPGARKVEDLFTGTAREAGVSRIGNAIRGGAGEAAAGSAGEVADTGIVNDALGQDITEGMGKSAALGLVLDGGAGAAAGALQSTRPPAQPAPAPQPEPQPEPAAPMAAAVREAAPQPQAQPAPRPVEESQAEFIASRAQNIAGKQRTDLVREWQDAETDEGRAEAAANIAAYDMQQRMAPVAPAAPTAAEPVASAAPPAVEPDPLPPVEQTAAPTAAAPIEPAAAAPQPVATPEPAPRRPFAQPDQVAREDQVQAFRDLGLSEEQAARAAADPRVARQLNDSVTGTFDARTGDMKVSTLRRAQQHAEETGEPAFFVSADIINLGGINEARGNIAAEANKDFRGMTDAVVAALRETGGDIVPMRTGGDELGFIAVGVTEAQLEAALEVAEQRSQQYAERAGIASIPHSKPGRDPGVGWHFGIARALPGRDAESVFNEADAGVDRSKKRRNPNVTGESTAAPGPAALEGQAGGTGRSVVEDAVGPARGGRAEEPGVSGGEVVRQRSGIPAGLPARLTDSTRSLNTRLNGWLRRQGRGDQQVRLRTIDKTALPDDVGRAIGAIEQATGVTVEVVRNTTPEVERFNGITFRDGTVYVDERADQPATLVAMHEWVHNLRESDADLYTRLEAEVRRQGRLPEWAARMERERNRTDDEGATEELVADAVADAFTDPEFLRALGRRDVGLFRQVADSVLDFLGRLLDGARDRGTAEYLQDVQAFRDVLADVVQEFSGRERGEATDAEADPAFQRAEDQTQTPEFRRWFGDSKVVDAEGRPLVVYHGTSADIEAFDSAMAGDGPSRFGFWMTPQADFAENFGDAVMPVYLQMRNPHRITGERWNDIRDKHAKDGAWFERWREQLIVKGHDGLIVTGETFVSSRGRSYKDPDVMAVFAPEQIKSAIGNRGTFDPDDARIAFQRPSNATRRALRQASQQTVLSELAARGYAQGSATFDYDKGRHEGVRGKLVRARENLQDKLYSMREAQADIERSLGVVLDDAQNVYRLENLAHGRASDQMDKLERDVLGPMRDIMRAADLSLDQLHDYLLARHAPERNAKVASINPDMQDGGSGISTADAQAIMAGTKAGPYSGKVLDGKARQELAKVGRLLDTMRDRTLDNMVRAGVISDQQRSQLKSAYKFYVPLRGKGDPDDFGGTDGGGGGGGRLDFAAPRVRRALGRGEGNLPNHIFAELLGDAERAIVSAELAAAREGVLRLAMQHPNRDVWEVEPVDMEWAFSEATGEAYLRVKGRLQAQADSLLVPLDGKTYRVRINDARLRDALLNLGKVDSNVVVRVLGAINRFQSATLTRYNPSFVAVNLLRDLGFGLTGIASEHGARAAAEVAAGYPQAAAALWRDVRGGQRGDASVPDARKGWGDWAREFSEAGGKTGITLYNDIEALSRRYDSGVRSLRGLWSDGLAGKGKATAQAVIRAGQPVLDVIDHANDAIENAIRLSLYVSLRKQGRSIEQAAEAAKNLTVNFNRKGNWAGPLGAVWLFYNAAVQGSHRVLKVLSDKRVLGGLTALGALQGVFALSMMADDDDEDGVSRWDAIPEYRRFNSFIVPAPWHDDGYFAVPMPYGFNAFTFMGGRVAQFTRDSGRSDERAASSFANDVMAGVARSFSPVPVDDPKQIFGNVPGILLSLASNTDDLGRPISAETFGRAVPAATTGRAGTPEVFTDLATVLNRIGGGSDDELPVFFPALTDVSPDQLAFLWREATGGIGGNISAGMSSIEGIAGGRFGSAVEAAAAAPLVRSFGIVGNRDRAVQDRYYRLRGDLGLAEDRAKRAAVELVQANGGDAAAAAADWEAVRATLGPLAQGLEPVRYKRNGTRPDGSRYRAGDFRMTQAGGLQLEPAPGSPLGVFKDAERVVREQNIAIREARIGDLSLTDREAAIKEAQRIRREAQQSVLRAVHQARNPR